MNIFQSFSNRTKALMMALVSSVFVPVLVFAQTSGTATKCFGNSSTNNLCTFITSLIDVINNFVVPLVFAVAFIVFIYGIYSYFVLGGSNEEKRQEGQQLALWGVIGFFIMLSVWGIVNVLVGTFGFDGQNNPGLPTFNTSSSATQSTSPATSPATTPLTGGN